MPDKNTNSEQKACRVFAPGSCAQVGDQPCRVIALTMREDVFVYQVAWWVGGERRIDSVSGCELKDVADSKYWTIEKK